MAGIDCMNEKLRDILFACYLLQGQFALHFLGANGCFPYFTVISGMATILIFTLFAFICKGWAMKKSIADIDQVVGGV